MILAIRFPKSAILAKNFQGGNFISGRGPKIKIYSPLNGEIIGEVFSTTKDEIHKMSVEALMYQKKWEEIGIKERTQVIFKFR